VANAIDPEPDRSPPNIYGCYRILRNSLIIKKVSNSPIIAESDAIYNSSECTNSQIPPLHSEIDEFLHFGRQFLSLFYWNYTLPIFRSHVIPGAPPIAQTLRLIYYVCPKPISFWRYHAAGGVEPPFSGSRR
jgi:hypothetical protein